jgi:hypothetical protein
MRLSGADVFLADDGQPSASSRLATLLGVTRHRVWAAGTRGLNEQQADEFATALGYHPSQVWPEWSWEEG